MVAQEEGGSGKVTVRHAEVGDAEAFHRIMTAPRVVAGTLQLPLQRVERARRFLAEPPRDRTCWWRSRKARWAGACT